MIDNQNKYIIAIGPNPAWQKALFFKKFTAGEINRAEEMQSFPSGKGVNFCRAAAQWNEFSTLLIQFAGGDTGKLLCAGLAEEKIEHRTIKADFPTRCSVTCLCRATQTMTEVIEPSHPLSTQAIEDFHRMLKTNLANCAGVAFCGTLPTGTGIELYVQAAETIKAAGLPLLVDSWQNIAPVLKVGGNMILKVNAEELQAITAENNTEKALSAAINSFPLSAIAVTDGPGNACLAFDHQLYSFQLPKLEHIVSPLGCGDTAAAVFLSEYLRGRKFPDAFANALAAASANCLTAVCGSFDITDAERIQKEIIITNKQF